MVKKSMNSIGGATNENRHQRDVEYEWTRKESVLKFNRSSKRSEMSEYRFSTRSAKLVPIYASVIYVVQRDLDSGASKIILPRGVRNYGHDASGHPSSAPP
jgi:hypothetical protein